ncbi:MAG TPA: hypothetical protein DER19_03160 [Eubacterium sp.]|nr:hypothetical protein [Eubacterium sp.]
MKAYYHLPGLFEFYELYKEFLPLYREHREYFYDWCEIGSIYGAPADCVWGGGRVGFGEHDPKEVLKLMQEYGISARLTFSNSLLTREHLSDKKCNELCRIFDIGRDNERGKGVGNDKDIEYHIDSDNDISGINKRIKVKECRNGIIIYSDLLLDYIKENYPDFYFVSSTTKVLTDFGEFENELNREDFRYVVPDFRLNKSFDKLKALSQHQKDKAEFLCNECCWFGCTDRKKCYETVSYKNLGEDCPEHYCTAPDSGQGYLFSKAMENPGFIGVDDIKNTYLPMGFSNFKIEGRGLGSVMILEFLLYYMTKPQYQIHVREHIYLDNMLDLF